MTVDFRSMLGFIGDLFAGWKRVPKHLGQQGQVQGWFRRGMGGYIVMKELTSTAGAAARASLLLAGGAVDRW